MRSNCLFWALALFVRRLMKGDEVYLSIRISRMKTIRWLIYPHFLVMRRYKSNGLFRAVSYKPTNPVPKPVPPVLFEGKPVWGDIP